MSPLPQPSHRRISSLRQGDPLHRCSATSILPLPSLYSIGPCGRLPRAAAGYSSGSGSLTTAGSFVPLLVLFVFVLVVILVVGISRWGGVGCEGENLVDATCPLLLQTSMKLYGVSSHVVFLLTFAFEGCAIRFFTERARPIHLSKLPVLAAMPKRFWNNRETSELFRLGSIILYLGLHGTYSGYALHSRRAGCKPLFHAAPRHWALAWLRWNELRSFSDRSITAGVRFDPLPDQRSNSQTSGKRGIQPIPKAQSAAGRRAQMNPTNSVVPA